MVSKPTKALLYLTKPNTMEKREKVVKKEKENLEIEEFHSVNMKKTLTMTAKMKASW